MSRREIHVGDIGTKYWVRVQDRGVDFDPTGAVAFAIIFSLPVHGVVELEADVETDASPATIWYLTYTVGAAGLGSPPQPFHAAAGRITLQGRITYGDGRTWTSERQIVDDDGHLLQIFPNLDS